jgi:hypothetical protein
MIKPQTAAAGDEEPRLLTIRLRPAGVVPRQESGRAAEARRLAQLSTGKAGTGKLPHRQARDTFCGVRSAMARKRPYRRSRGRPSAPLHLRTGIEAAIIAYLNKAHYVMDRKPI